MKSLGIIFIISLLFAAAQSQSKLKSKDVEAIKQIEETYRTAWLKNDEAEILSLFSDDATIYPSGFPPAKGKEAIKNFWFAPWDSVTNINEYEVKISEVFGEKNLAVAVGENTLEWSLEKKDKSSVKRYVSKGYFTAVYVRKDKRWQIFKRHWSNKTEEI